MATTKIKVYNSIVEVTSNQVLMFLQPTTTSTDFMFNAWNVLNPAYHSYQSVDLSTTFAASIATWASTHGDYTDPVALELGHSLTVTDLNNQSPIITNVVHGPLKDSQVGIYNDAITPDTNLSVVWYVSGKKVVETNNTTSTTLNPGISSLFELKQFVYLMFGQAPSNTTTYTQQTVSDTTAIAIPNGATEVCIEAYMDDKGMPAFRVRTPAQFATLERNSHLLYQQHRRNVAKVGDFAGLGAGDPVVHQLSEIAVISLYRDTLLNHTGRGQGVFVDGSIVELKCGDFGTNLPVVGDEYRITGHDDTLGIDFSYTLTCTRAGRVSHFRRDNG